MLIKRVLLNRFRCGLPCSCPLAISVPVTAAPSPLVLHQSLDSVQLFYTCLPLACACFPAPPFVLPRSFVLLVLFRSSPLLSVPFRRRVDRRPCGEGCGEEEGGRWDEDQGDRLVLSLWRPVSASRFRGPTTPPCQGPNSPGFVTCPRFPSLSLVLVSVPSPRAMNAVQN